jgi:hypothetical protein
VTNPHEVISGGYPKFQQVGPYVYRYAFRAFEFENVFLESKIVLDVLTDWSSLTVHRQKRQKVDIKFHPENDTVSYRQIMTYFYEPSMSNGSLQDVVNAINLPFLVKTYITGLTYM